MSSFPLDPSLRCQDAIEFENQLSRRIIGQPEAVRAVCHAYQTFLAELNAPQSPVSTLLFLGPTGTGKTKVVEAV